MPTKNRDFIIKESIQSIIDQTIKDWELIIVDDHSNKNDKTEEIVNKLNDPRIKYIKLPDNWATGIAEARNFGNMFVNSPIIAVADSDDYFVPKRAELTIQAFKKENCDVFYGNYIISDKRTGKIIKDLKCPAVPFDIKVFREYNFVPHVSSAYKTELAYAFPYNSFFVKAQDYDFFTRLAMAGKRFYYCNEIIFHYVMTGDNISIKEPGIYGNIIKSNLGVNSIDRYQELNKLLSHFCLEKNAKN